MLKYFYTEYSKNAIIRDVIMKMPQEHQDFLKLFVCRYRNKNYHAVCSSVDGFQENALKKIYSIMHEMNNMIIFFKNKNVYTRFIWNGLVDGFSFIDNYIIICCIYFSDDIILQSLNEYIKQELGSELIQIKSPEYVHAGTKKIKIKYPFTRYN